MKKNNTYRNLYFKNTSKWSIMLNRSIAKFFSLVVLLVALSSFEIKEEVSSKKENRANHVLQPIHLPAQKPLELLPYKPNALSNSFLNFIPGLREYLFRFKRSDLKSTC